MQDRHGDGSRAVPPQPDSAALVCQVSTFLRRYVVLNDSQAAALALWIMHTHALAAVDVTPYVHITSATKRAGKTRLLEVLSLLVPKPWLTGRATAAVLVRKVDHDQPTLLLDEMDAAFGQQNEYSESLRGILNSGYKRNGTASLCVPVKGNYIARDFKTFCPKALAGIQDIPDTVADRSIRIQLRRKRTDEPVERFQTRKVESEAGTLRPQLAGWANRTTPSLMQAETPVLEALNDRAFEIWEPLLCIADRIGGRWPRLAREAALELSGRTDDADQGVQLLEDTREYVDGVDAEFVGTTALVDYLKGLEDRPYRDFRRGTGLTGSQLARMLKPFGIVPSGPTRQGSTVKRGYRVSAFEDAFARYLQPLQRNNPAIYEAEHASASRNAESRCNVNEGVTNAQFPERSNAVTPCEPDDGDILELR